MRVAKLLAESGNKPVISFEFSRPKTEKAAANLDRALETLKKTEPGYVSVTFGAGGSNRQGSFELVDKLKNEHGLSVAAYIAGVGLSPAQLGECCDKFKSLAVETLFVIRGDAPTWDDSYTPHPEALAHGSDMLKLINERYDFCLGAAGYPEGHIEAESKEKDLEYLELKVANGAEYIVAQYFYDNQYFFDFVERCRAAGITVPIVPGVMPIYSVKLMENLARICGATITEEIRTALGSLAPDDKKGVTDFGVEHMTKQCRGLLEHGVDGLHFYTMNRAKSVATVIETLRGEGLL